MIALIAAAATRQCVWGLDEIGLNPEHEIQSEVENEQTSFNTRNRRGINLAETLYL